MVRTCSQWKIQEGSTTIPCGEGRKCRWLVVRRYHSSAHCVFWRHTLLGMVIFLSNPGRATTVAHIFAFHYMGDSSISWDIFGQHRFSLTSTSTTVLVGECVGKG